MHVVSLMFTSFDCFSHVRIILVRPIDTTSFTDIPSINECETKCVQDDCYGFEYNSKEKSCDVFMSHEDQSQWPTKSVRCDKKVTCPCFQDNEVEN